MWHFGAHFLGRPATEYGDNIERDGDFLLYIGPKAYVRMRANGASIWVEASFLLHETPAFMMESVEKTNNTDFRY